MSDSLQSHGLQPARLLCPWGFSRQECWSGVPCSPPGDLPDPGFKPKSPAAPALQADYFTAEPLGEAITGTKSKWSSWDLLVVNRWEHRGGDSEFCRPGAFQKESWTLQKGQWSHLCRQWGDWKKHSGKCNSARKFFAGTGQHWNLNQEMWNNSLFEVTSWNIRPARCLLVLVTNAPLPDLLHDFLSFPLSFIIHFITQSLHYPININPSPCTI